MSTRAAGREWFNDIVAGNRSVLSENNSPWLDATREGARQALSRIQLPDRKQEAWRYTDVSGLYTERLRPVRQRLSREIIDAIDWAYPFDDSYRLVFVNGRFEPEYSCSGALEDGIVMGSLREALATDPALVSRWLRKNSGGKADAFSVLNRALLDDGLLLHVRENTSIDKPVEVLYLNASGEDKALVQPRSLVVLETGSRATLLERYAGIRDDGYFFNGASDLYLGANARLQHYRLQNEAPGARHLCRVALSLDTASEYRGVNIATGGGWSRTDIHARFAGEQATCDLEGLYTVGHGQYNDFHLDIVHNLPHCRSTENFRGIVHGKGRAVFDGRILVEKDAQKTDAQLSNKNLLLEPNAEVDTKPQLEIHADDVKCSHGTTVGRVDPNQLFYLRSRGISESQARKILCLGFAEQVLENVDDEAVHACASKQIAALFANPERHDA